MKLTFVLPRYGLEVQAGAENAARQLAERAAARFGWTVEALTTGALDLRTWAEDLPPGREELNGVTVHRFPLRAGRDPEFHGYSAPLLSAPTQATEQQADRWIELQGPVSPALVEAVAQSDADVLAFYPYLYHPTVAGLRAARRLSVLHAAAHDEAPIRLPVFRDVFARPEGLVFHTYTERDLVNRLFPVTGRPQLVLGLGVDEGSGEEGSARQALGLGDAPYLLCLGRVDDQKGTGFLWRAFGAYKQRRPGPLRLVLAGPVVDGPDPHPDIVVTGPVSEDVKWGLLRGARALVSPSALESFSIVMAEAWSVGTPVVVNAACSATMENVRRSGGGLCYRGYAELEAVVDRLGRDDGLLQRMGEAGRQYVRREFSWDTVLERYGRFLQSLGARVD